MEGGKGRKAGRRQELAPIAIVNPLLAHGDILGLERHKKSSEEIEIEAMKKRKRWKRRRRAICLLLLSKYSENFVTDGTLNFIW